MGKAVKLRNEQGILAMPQIHKKKKITEATVQAAIAMFMEDEYSRQMPGRKDCVTVNKVKHQKRSLLFKLEEMYKFFKGITMA